MTAQELYESLYPPTPEEAVDIAAAFLDEMGDLPQTIHYQLGLAQATPKLSDIVWLTLSELRDEHFAERGLTPPPYTQTLL